MSAGFSEAVTTLVGAVAQADGVVSDEEFHLLYHIVQKDLPKDQVKARLAELANLSVEEARLRMHRALRGMNALPLDQRLRILAIGYDFCAVDGVENEELEVLSEAARLLDIEQGDQNALLYAMIPDEVPAALPASPILRFVHIGPWSGADFFMPLDARITIIEIGPHMMLRIMDTGGSTYLDNEPILLRGMVTVSR